MITDLRIHHFRNIEQASLQLARYNLITGLNGSGKTSLLEAVFLLSRGRSFRHHEPKRYISHHQTACVVWAKTNFSNDLTEGSALAVKKQLDAAGKSETALRLNGLPIRSQGELSLHVPTLLVDPSSMGLLDEGSASRRQMLDWLAFHVKPNFYAHWLQYQKLLKQRNGLLKHPNACAKIAEMAAWDEQLSRHAHALHDDRQAVFEMWLPVFYQALEQLLPRYAHTIQLQYNAGFDVHTPMQQTLAARVSQDIELGYTRVGAHRADVLLILKKQDENGQKIRDQATHVLSRGEKKLLITAIRLSQLMLICRMIENSQIRINPPTVLIDDIDSELDVGAIEVLLDAILPLDCQLLISSLSEDIDAKIQKKLKEIINNTNQNTRKNLEKSYKVFRMENGVIHATQTHCFTEVS